MHIERRATLLSTFLLFVLHLTHKRTHFHSLQYNYRLHDNGGKAARTQSTAITTTLPNIEFLLLKKDDKNTLSKGGGAAVHYKMRHLKAEIKLTAGFYNTF